MVEPQLESDVMGENERLVSMLGLMSGTVTIGDEDVSLNLDWTGGSYVKVYVDGYDERVVFDLNEMAEEGVDRILEASDDGS